MRRLGGGVSPGGFALLIAGVGVLAMVVGAARITQLRRLFAARAVRARAPGKDDTPTP